MWLKRGAGDRGVVIVGNGQKGPLRGCGVQCVGPPSLPYQDTVLSLQLILEALVHHRGGVHEEMPPWPTPRCHSKDTASGLPGIQGKCALLV